MNNRHIYVLSAVLALIGLALFAYKSQVLGFPLQPQEQTRVWTIEATLEDYVLLGPGQRPRFEVDREHIMKLVQGANLYSDKFACVRELLQNAIDADDRVRTGTQVQVRCPEISRHAQKVVNSNRHKLFN